MECRLTVLMTVYNGALYLSTAIESILAQTYSEFRFLIIDDASTDESRDVVRSYEDQRIELLCLGQNVGQTAALNIGLRHASTQWIARMDADDYSAPDRLQYQMQTLDVDPFLACVGTFAWTFRDDPRMVEKVITTPADDAGIRGLLAGTPMIHGSLVFSREAVLSVGGYNERYRITQDIDLYDRLLPRYSAANVPKQLLGIRTHPEQASLSIVALQENIDIDTQRLLTKDYSEEQARIVRFCLSRGYMLRARYHRGHHRYLRFGADLFRALRTSPGTFLRSITTVFLLDHLPDAQRAKLRRIVRHIGS